MGEKTDELRVIARIFKHERRRILEDVADEADRLEANRDRLEAELAEMKARWTHAMEFMHETSKQHVEPAVRSAFSEVRSFFMENAPVDCVRVVVVHGRAMPFSIDGKGYDPRLEYDDGQVLYLVRAKEVE